MLFFLVSKDVTSCDYALSVSLVGVNSEYAAITFAC